jgi:hypothetical protein
MDVSFETQHIRRAGHVFLAGSLEGDVIGVEYRECRVNQAVDTFFPFRVLGL